MCDEKFFDQISTQDRTPFASMIGFRASNFWRYIFTLIADQAHILQYSLDYN